VVSAFGDLFTLAFILVAMLDRSTGDSRWSPVSVLPLVFFAASLLFRARYIRDAYRAIQLRLARHQRLHARAR
jgi:hypothetical protein